MMVGMDPVAYDELSLFHQNASEFGLPWPGPPNVRREDVALTGGGTLSALVWGPDVGPPELVLLHGTAMNAHTWDTVALALDRPLVAFDLPGHGHSSWREDSAYTPDHLAEAVAQGVERLAPQAEAVVGMSLGGMTAMVLAVEWPELVRRLVLVDITPGVDRRKAQAIIDFVDGPQTFPSFDAILARTIEHNPTRSESSLRRGILHNAHPLPDGSWAWNYDRRGRAQPSADALPDPADASHGQPAPSPLWDVLARVDVPLLLVRGGASPVVDDADVAELRRRQPDAEVVVVDGAGHSIQGDQPLVLARILDALFD
jgi:pimeloyl-ACP methyl ester carboxylesterase